MSASQGHDALRVWLTQYCSEPRPQVLKKFGDMSSDRLEEILNGAVPTIRERENILDAMVKGKHGKLPVAWTPEG